MKQSLLLDVPTPKCHGEEGSSGQHAWKHQTQVKKKSLYKTKIDHQQSPEKKCNTHNNKTDMAVL